MTQELLDGRKAQVYDHVVHGGWDDEAFAMISGTCWFDWMI